MMARHEYNGDLIVHVVHALDVGGMELMLVDLIRRSPPRFRHVVVCLTDYSGLGNVLRGKARCYALHKRPGKDFPAYQRLWRLLRRLRPAVVQTYNISCIDVSFVAWLAGVPTRLHAEHGRTSDDPQGKNRKYRLMRRALQPFVDRYIAVSRELADWLVDDLHVDPAKVLQINNGIDTSRYRPRDDRPLRREWPDLADDDLLIGTVGRLDAVKDQRTLLQAFNRLATLCPAEASRCRLAIIGEGPMRSTLEREIKELGVGDRVWLVGRRDDVPALLGSIDVFALSSIAEGIPLTVLEAMASERPVIATAVGGLADVIDPQDCGTLVPPGDVGALAEALAAYVCDPALRRAHGAAARRRVESQFNVTAMADEYFSLYDEATNRALPQRATLRRNGGVGP